MVLKSVFHQFLSQIIAKLLNFFCSPLFGQIKFFFTSATFLVWSDEQVEELGRVWRSFLLVQWKLNQYKVSSMVD
jgi:hypothetical protein